MTSSGFIKDTYAASRLLSFSTSSLFFSLDYSRQILYQIENPNGFSLNALMRACNQRNSPQSCLLLYKLIPRSDSFPDNYTYPIVMEACSLRLSAIEGRMVHTHVVKLSFDADVYAVNNLIRMYSACGRLEDARVVFDNSPVLDLVSWNTILASYVGIGDVEESTRLFGRMTEKNVIASNSMIALFGKTNLVDDARELFDEMPERDVVTWTAIITCYEQNGKFDEALEVFVRMHKEGILMDEVVMVSVLSACAQVASRVGELIHGLVTKIGVGTYVNLSNALINFYASCGNVDSAKLLFDLAMSGHYADQISCNSMIAGYSKCGLLLEAKDVFDKISSKDLVSWSTMISGYCKHDRFSEALSLFQEMQVGEIKPDATTLVSAVKACAHLFALEQGKWIHAYIKKHRFHVNVFLGTSLVDMYMKLGCVDTALEVFNELEEKGISTWNANIMGLAMNGLVNEAFEKFSEMEKFGVVPNEITFVGVLGACRHVGLVNEGRRYFNSMMHVYNIEPNIEHYGCMVDLFGRAGLLKEAEELIESMPMAPDVATWGALLGACKKHGDSEIGERVGRRLIELEPQHDGFHILLSNIYASNKKWDELRDVRGKMKQKGVIKVPGCSMIESDGIIHEFLAGDNSHPRMKEIEIMLEEIAIKLKAEGYVPNTSDVAFDIDEEEKESSVYRHSEKIAIAFGLISISTLVPIRIAKNLRICSDCHASAKIISKAFQREIVVRDRHRFHHFKDGVCSCQEYW
ncbi:uncharacterized protein A4U43_C05F1860 [Asparagus officinalis]|uniref:DYW domain-containing protein n=2 Tax=Asparagus officinalis TaxID=4686 RepID=A0A5P1ESC8_ASPOF|nr:uncharacterized protein A4U43_C05F1860 [Asparagus officinalis]